MRRIIGSHRLGVPATRRNPTGDVAATTTPGTMFSVHSTLSPVRRRLLSVAGLLLLVVPALTGCLRVQATMGISSDDRVSGQIVAATIPADENDPGPELSVPVTLAGKVRVQEYAQDGYVGTQVFFDNLTFGDLEQLSTMSDQSAGSFQLSVQRAGDLVSLAGRVDLESAPTQGTDVQFTVAFPELSLIHI